jgi:hypothetical protein
LLTRALGAVGVAEDVQRRLLPEVMSLLAGLEEEVPPPVSRGGLPV